MSEMDELLDTYSYLGGEASIVDNPDIAHLVALEHKILSSRTVKGLIVDAKETHAGISARVTVEKGVHIKNPIHICFGIIHKEGSQEIKMDVRLEEDSSATFIAHCMFPNAVKVRHIMDAVVVIGRNAELRYSEVHFHGPHGGVEVIPRARIIVHENGRYYGDFTLTTGRVGRLSIDYDVEAGKNAISELTARVFGHGTDNISVKDRINLMDEGARGLVKIRIAIEDDATAEVTGITEGNAPYARGHVDCMEIVKDRATARAMPIVNVTNPLAKVTHEAAIGSVDKKQLETLMAHGLSQEEAVDIIVKGILK